MIMWESWLAGRWMSRSRGRMLARSLRGMSISSIALCVAALIIVHAVFSGFHHALTEKFLNVSPHIVLTSPQRNAALPIDARVDPAVPLYPVVRGNVVVQVAGREGYADVGVTLYGVDVAMLQRWSQIEWLFAAGAVQGTDTAAALAAAFAGAAPDALAGAICGFDVMTTLGADPTRETLRFIAPFSLLDPAGNVQPFSRRAAPRALFRTTLFAFDSTTCFLARADAEQLLGLQAETEWWGFAADRARIDAIALQLRTQLGPAFSVTTWQQRNARLFAALATEERLVLLLLGLMSLIALTTLASTVTLLARQHQRDVALTLVLGATPARAARVVLLFGLRLAAHGVAWGLAVSLATLAVLRVWPITLPTTFYLDHLPVMISWHTMLLPACAVWIATCVAAYYPAWRVRQLSVAQILREG